MTKADIGEIGCKLLSVYTVIHAVGALGLPISIFGLGKPSTLVSVLSFAPAVMLLAVSALLWLYAYDLNFTPESSQPSSGSSSVTPLVLQRIVFSIAGILILVGTLPYLGQVVLQGLQWPPFRDQNFWMNVVQSLIRLALGIWLVVGSRRLQKWGSRLLDSMIHKDW
jgi:hypothetical protein